MSCGSCPSLIKGAVGVAMSVAGLGIARDETIEQRASQCRACPHAVPCVVQRGRLCMCGLCGCGLKHKIRLRKERCPLPEPRWVEEVEA